MGIFSKLAGSFVNERISNTKTALQLIIEDFKRYLIILKWIFISFSAATLIYGIVSKTGLLVINISLLGLLAVYSLLDTLLRIKQKPNASRKIRIVYAWLKILLNGAALIASLYSIYSATSSAEIKPISIVLATLSIIMFILKVIIEICFEILQSKWSLLKDAMLMDAKDHPHTSAKMFSPIIGDAEEVDVKESHARRIRVRQEKE